MSSKVGRSIPKLRFHIHEPVLFDFPLQTTLINQVVFKSAASKIIPQLQLGSLEKSFRNVMADAVDGGNINDNEVKSLYRKVYKPFLKDRDFARYFTSAAIVNQIRLYLSGNLNLRNDADKFLKCIRNDKSSTFGILRSDYLKSVGVMDHHYENLLFHVGRRSNIPLKCPSTQVLSPSNNLLNEDLVIQYLNSYSPGSNVTDYLLINSPTQAESLTTLSFKLGMKVVLITEPYFEQPTSILTGLLSRYEHSKNLGDVHKCKSIQTQLSQLNQITVKNLNEFQDFLRVIKDTKFTPREKSVHESSFWGKLQQMEMSILGELESKINKPNYKANYN